MDKIALKAEERIILGKKVKSLRREGVIPGHVFGKNLDTEHVSVNLKDFFQVYNQAGETGLVDLKIGDEKVRPVLIREVQYDPLKDTPLNISFYQVNLKEKVKVPVPVVVTGEEPELVHMGEAVILQTLAELEVEALPTDLVENIEVDISNLKNIDDAIIVSQLNYDKDKLTVLADQEEIVVKLAPAITEEMRKLMEEQAAEAAAAAEAQAEEAGEVAEGAEREEAAAEDETQEAEAAAEQQTEDSKKEEQVEEKS